MKLKVLYPIRKKTEREGIECLVRRQVRHGSIMRALMHLGSQQRSLLPRRIGNLPGLYVVGEGGGRHCPANTSYLSAFRVNLVEHYAMQAHVTLFAYTTCHKGFSPLLPTICTSPRFCISYSFGLTSLAEACGPTHFLATCSADIDPPEASAALIFAARGS